MSKSKEEQLKAQQEETKRLKEQEAKIKLKEEEVKSKQEETTKQEQLVTKGPVLQVSEEEPGTVISDDSKETITPAFQVARAGKPTGSDVPYLTTENIIVPKNIPSEENLPQNRARLQTDNRNQELQKEKDYQEKLNNLEKEPELMTQVRSILNSPNTHQHLLSGQDDSSIPGSRSGNPLENLGESQLGDKVHNITMGSQGQMGTRLEVQTKDKSVSIPVLSHYYEEAEKEFIKKKKVSLLFPGINPHVSQKELAIFITLNPQANEEESDPLKKKVVLEPAVQVFPPDVPNLEILLPINSKIHIELTHIDKNGVHSHPYMLDFYTFENNLVNPGITHPLEASPIGYVIMEDVLTIS
jgi:hypothetical protein